MANSVLLPPSSPVPLGEHPDCSAKGCGRGLSASEARTALAQGNSETTEPWHWGPLCRAYKEMETVQRLEHLQGLNAGESNGEGKPTSSLSVGKRAHTHVWVPLYLPRGGEACSLPHLCQEFGPKACKPLKIFIWAEIQVASFCLTHTQAPKAYTIQAEDARTTVLPCNNQIPVKCLKIYSHPTHGTQRNNTYKDLVIPQLHKPPGFNILNHMTKFKILYLLDTTGKSQRRALEHTKKTCHPSDLHDLHIPATDCIYNALFHIIPLTFSCRSAPLLTESSVFSDMVVLFILPLYIYISLIPNIVVIHTSN